MEMNLGRSELNLLDNNLGQWEIECENAEAYVIRPRFYALQDESGIQKGVKQNSYRRMTDDNSSLSSYDLRKVSETKNYDERSILFKEIAEHAK